MLKIGPFHADTIVLGDPIDIMGQLPEESIDFAITEPPVYAEGQWRSYPRYLKSVKAWLDGLFRVLKLGARVVWIVPLLPGKNREDGLLPLPHDSVGIALKVGFALREELVLDISPDDAASSTPLTGVRFLMRGLPKHILEFQKPVGSKKPSHPAIPLEHKPLEVIGREDFRKSILDQTWSGPYSAEPESDAAADLEQVIQACIHAWTPKRGIVFDPFIGEGTKVLLAMELRRHFLGCAPREKQSEIALRAIQKVQDHSPGQ